MGQSMQGSFLLLTRFTLEGPDAFNCVFQSSASAPGALIYGLFLVVIVIMLLNTLIAMMAQTFAEVYSHAFADCEHTGETLTQFLAFHTADVISSGLVSCALPQTRCPSPTC